MNISIKKEMPIINTRDTIKTSMVRIPLFIRKSNNMVSNAVRLIPQIKGSPKRRLSPMAIPTISARSQAAMAISANT